MDFLFHKVSEKEKQEIQKQARGIMDSFSKELMRVKDKIKDFSLEREESEREEGRGEKCEMDREIMFENAPKKDDDSIIAEKGEWK